MARDKIDDIKQKQLAGLSEIYSDQSWSIAFSDADDCLIIRTTDYHAGPLKLPLARLAEYKKTLKESASRTERDMVKRPADLHQVGQQNKWILAVSKKEKCLFIASKGEGDPPLKLSRKELYAIGKMMNKRVKRVRKILF